MTFDFRYRLGISVEEIGQSVSVREAVHLIVGLLQDQGSHLFASLAGWAYPMSRSDFHTAALLQTVKNALRGENDPPFEVDWPWPEEATSDVTDEERAELTARLRASSAIASVRSPEAVPSTTE